MKKTISEYAGILFGCFLTSVAFVFFINPYKLVPGGVFGTSIVLHNLMPAIQVGTFGYMISIPLLILSYFILGKNIGARTLVASLVTPFLMNMLTLIAYPNPEAVQSLDPSLLAGGVIDLSNDLILACIIGPALMGVGEGIMMRCKATSGGSDIVAMIIHKYVRIRFSKALLLVDGVVVLFGLLVIGMGFGSDTVNEHSWVLSGYSLVCIFVASQTVAYVVSGSKSHKLMFIITESHRDDIRDFVLHKLDRTATVLESHGLYTEKKRDTLMIALRLKEVNSVTAGIRELDPTAFVVVTDAYDAYGQRWKELPTKHEIQLS